MSLNLNVVQSEDLRNLTIQFIKILKQRFNINIQKTIKDLNKYIYIEHEITEDEYKVKKYLENILQYDIHIISDNCNNLTEIVNYINNNINIKISEEYIKNIITNYLIKINKLR